MIKTQLFINLNEEAWETEIPGLAELSNQILQKTMDFLEENEDLGFPDKPLVINLALSNDAEVKELNKEFRGKDAPTNVLSFANIDDEEFDNNVELFDEIELGDIIIALETMQREAAEKGISLKDHYTHLFIHGVLHLLGFDHIEDEDADYMEDFETKILHTLGIKNPYED